MRTGSLHRELIVAGVLLTLTAGVLLVTLLALLDSDLDPSEVPPAEVGVEYVAAKASAPAPPPLPTPSRAPEPTPEPAKPPPPPPEPTTMADADDLLRGRVQTKAGEPIAGARILVKKGRQVLGEASSTGDGTFSVGPLESGRLRIEVSATGYAKEEMSRTSIPKTPLTVVLKEGGTIRGKVLDDWTGEPLVRASVRVGRGLARRGKGIRSRSYDKGSRTDEAGEFAVEGLPAGAYSVAASHRGYGVEALEGVEVGSDAAESVVLRLKKEAIIEGRVVDDLSGEPVSKALVVFRPPLPAGPRRARTRRDGTFILKGVSSGRASIEVSRTGYVTKWLSGLDLTPGESKTDVEVRLQKGGASLQPGLTDPMGGRSGGRRGGFQYAGIGAVVQPAKGGGGIEIRNVMPGGAAAEAGLSAGTRILEVDGQPVDGKSLTRVVEWLRGEEGEAVTMKIVGPDGEQRLVQPVRKLMTMGKPKG